MLKLWSLLLFIPLSLFAQNSVTGKVVNAADKHAIPDASIFLNNTTTGAKTSTDGSFSLSHIPDGVYKLVVSCVGFEPYTQTINIVRNVHLDDIELVPKINELGEVKITSKHRSAGRNLYLRIFTVEFLGQTKNARECKIINPGIIHFAYDGDSEKLTASTSDFLIIENRALGYRIKYRLVSFLNDPRWRRTTYTGMSFFEKLDSTAMQQKIWDERRAETYRNSLMHFLRASISGRYEGEHFTVWKVLRTPLAGRPPDSLVREKLNSLRGYPNTSPELTKWLKIAKQQPYEQTVDRKPPAIDEYIKHTGQKGIYSFGFPFTLMINYDSAGNGSNKNSSFVTFTAPSAFFDSNGVIFTPENCIIAGFWGTKRIAELLPDDYKLP